MTRSEDVTEASPDILPKAEPTGFEPAISCVTGRRVRPLHYGSSATAAEALGPRPWQCQSYQKRAPSVKHFFLIFTREASFPTTTHSTLPWAAGATIPSP